MLINIFLITLNLTLAGEAISPCFKEVDLSPQAFEHNQNLYQNSDYVFIGRMRSFEPLSDGSGQTYVRVTAIIDRIYKNKNNMYKVGQKIEFKEPKPMYDTPFDMLKQRDLMLVERDGALHSLAFHSKYTPEQIITLLDSSSKAPQ